MTNDNITAHLRRNWITLITVIKENLPEDLAECYILMLEKLKDDTTVGDKTLLGMYRAPAANNRHHRYEGGLVHHYIEMWRLWVEFLGPATETADSPDMLAFIERNAHLSNKHVLQGILNHDIHKAYRRYVLISADPWKTDYAKDEDYLTRMLGNDGKSIALLNRHNIPMHELHYNALLLCEGGFSKTKTEWTSVLAKVLYLLDELSANVMSRIEADLLLNSKCKEPEVPRLEFHP